MSSGCDVPPDTPFENVQAMVDAGAGIWSLSQIGYRMPAD